MKTKSALLHTLLALVALGLAAGCATGTKGASDEEQIQALLDTWEAGILAKDVGKIMATISEEFTHDGYEYEAPDKATLQEFIEASIDEGNLDDVEISLEDAQISIDGASATVYPIDYTNIYGTVTFELVATKEKGGWLFTDMIIEGL